MHIKFNYYWIARNKTYEQTPRPWGYSGCFQGTSSLGSFCQSWRQPLLWSMGSMMWLWRCLAPCSQRLAQRKPLSSLLLEGRVQNYQWRWYCQQGLPRGQWISSKCPLCLQQPAPTQPLSYLKDFSMKFIKDLPLYEQLPLVNRIGGLTSLHLLGKWDFYIAFYSCHTQEQKRHRLLLPNVALLQIPLFCLIAKQSPVL